MARQAAKKPSRRELRRQALAPQASYPGYAAEPDRVPVRKAQAPLEARTRNQAKFIQAIEEYQLVFATGAAGTGKTFIAGAKAALALDRREVDKIIITRPMVDADEDIGYLPGTADEKFAPFFAPFKEVLEERLGKSYVEYLIKVGRIEIAPLAFMRGRTFKNAFVVLDEAQNTTPTQMKLFLTRLGDHCRVIVNGDLNQKDIKGQSGLQDALNRLTYIPLVKHVAFGPEDVVRSPLVAEIVHAYDQEPTVLVHS